MSNGTTAHEHMVELASFAHELLGVEAAMNVLYAYARQQPDGQFLQRWRKLRGAIDELTACIHGLQALVAFPDNQPSSTFTGVIEPNQILRHIRDWVNRWPILNNRICRSVPDECQPLLKAIGFKAQMTAFRAGGWYLPMPIRSPQREQRDAYEQQQRVAARNRQRTTRRESRVSNPSWRDTAEAPWWETSRPEPMSETPVSVPLISSRIDVSRPAQPPSREEQRRTLRKAIAAYEESIRHLEAVLAAGTARDPDYIESSLQQEQQGLQEARAALVVLKT